MPCHGGCFSFSGLSTGTSFASYTTTTIPILCKAGTTRLNQNNVCVCMGLNNPLVTVLVTNYVGSGACIVME